MEVLLWVFSWTNSHDLLTLSRFLRPRFFYGTAIEIAIGQVRTHDDNPLDL